VFVVGSAIGLKPENNEFRKRKFPQTKNNIQKLTEGNGPSISPALKKTPMALATPNRIPSRLARIEKKTSQESVLRAGRSGSCEGVGYHRPERDEERFDRNSPGREKGVESSPS